MARLVVNRAAAGDRDSIGRDPTSQMAGNHISLTPRFAAISLSPVFASLASRSLATLVIACALIAAGGIALRRRRPTTGQAGSERFRREASPIKARPAQLARPRPGPPVTRCRPWRPIAPPAT